jgi:hypothetical protein
MTAAGASLQPPKGAGILKNLLFRRASVNPLFDLGDFFGRKLPHVPARFLLGDQFAIGTISGDDDGATAAAFYHIRKSG